MPSEKIIWIRNSQGTLWADHDGMTATVWMGPIAKPKSYRFLILRDANKVGFEEGFMDEPAAMLAAEGALRLAAYGHG